MNKELYHIIQNIQKVTGFLVTTGIPVPVSDNEINKILGNIHDLRYAMPVVNSTYDELINTTSKNIDEYKNGILTFQKSIKLEQIDHTYQGTSQPTVNRVSINIPFGALIGFVGESGSGKSTLIDIILGLLNPINLKK